MTIKIALLVFLFSANLFGLLALLSHFFNLSFKAFFGYTNKRTGNKKLYWIGHIILVLLLFYFWTEFVSVTPSLLWLLFWYFPQFFLY